MCLSLKPSDCGYGPWSHGDIGLLKSIQRREALEARAGGAGLAKAANIGTLGLAGVTGANALGGLLGGREVSDEIDDLVARAGGAGLAKAANIGTLGLAGITGLNALTGGNKRDLEEAASEIIARAVIAKVVQNRLPGETEPNIGGTVWKNRLGNKRELEEELVARAGGAGLAKAANIGTLGLAGITGLNALTGGGKRDLIEKGLIARAGGLGKAANVATIGLAANGLLGGLLGGGKREAGIAELD